MRHLDIEYVLRVGLCLYALSENGGHKDEARRTPAEKAGRAHRAKGMNSSRSNSLCSKLGNLSYENWSNTSERASPPPRSVCTLRLCELALEQM